jgi:lipoprotein-releasing system permease protein
MILSVAIVTGFKQEIRNKVVGFGSHIQIVNDETNFSYETQPISKKQDFYPSITNIQGINHIQVFAIKAGIIKAGYENQGIVLKGIDKDFNWSFFKESIIEGTYFEITDSVKSNKVLISEYISSLLNLKLGDKFKVFFIDEEGNLRGRPLIIEGIYNTGMEEFDKTFALVDIKHIQKLNNWSSDMVSGFEITIDNYDDLEEITTKLKTVRKQI